MSERVALITGGAKGIGRALALDLGRSGWSVALCYRTSAREADAVVSELGGRNKALAVACDVSDAASAERLVCAVEQRFSRVDALINCAGPYHRVGLLDETPEGWRAMFDANLHSVFYMSRLVAGGMKRRGWGRIVSFAMANADLHSAQPQLTAHYIAKAGVLMLTRSLAKALGPHGVTANAVSPGFIASGSAPDAELAAMVKNIPAGYLGETADAVAAVRFLLSEEARYVNGGNIHLSGGWGV